MRFLLYNIRYGTGGRRRRLPISGYFRRTSATLGNMLHFMKNMAPDLVGLVEVDAGSYRSGHRNQAQWLADHLGHYHTYRSKYALHSAHRFFPVLNKQGNAFLARDTVHGERFHYFDKGMKRLVIELELEQVTVFLVHLALGFRVRHTQLADLYALVRETNKPHLVAGDFNALWGDREMKLFQAATRLRSANTGGAATFPSWAPRRQLDFILYSPGIHIQRFWMPPVTYSDHLPLLCDFTVAPQKERP